LSAYTGFGLAAALAGHFASEEISPKLVSILSGGGTLLVGVSLFLRRKNTTCAKESCAAKPMMPGGLFLMGYAMALSPCGPLTAILLAAAATQNAITGASLGLAFGLGAILAPALVFGIGVSYASQQLREMLGESRRYAELASASLLSASGLFNLLRWRF
jgi:thiol:disulfide interchange protein DsbD